MAALVAYCYISNSESEVAQSCPTLCDPVDCSLPGFSVHGILQARVLEWVTISFSRGSSWPRDWTWASRIGGRHFNLWATRDNSAHNDTHKPSVTSRTLWGHLISAPCNWNSSVEAGRSASNMAYSHGWRVVTGYWFLSTQASLMGSLCFLTVWWFSSKKRERERESIWKLPVSRSFHPETDTAAWFLVYKFLVVFFLVWF